MKRQVLLLLGLSNFFRMIGGDLPIILDDGTKGTFKLNTKDPISGNPFSHLIVQAHKNNQHFLLARADPSDNPTIYLDGKTVLELPQEVKEGTLITYYLLTEYNQKNNGFVNLSNSLTEDELKKIAKGSGFNDAQYYLNLGNRLLNDQDEDLALEFLVLAWKKGNLIEQWQAYQGFEKIIFPNLSENNLVYYYRKAYMGYHFLKDFLGFD